MSNDVYGEGTRLRRHTGSVPSKTVSIYMAGDVSHAKQVIRQFVLQEPSCVTVVAADYVYAGGEEAGFVVAFRAYPRFPGDVGGLSSKATRLANRLREALGQRSYMIDDGTTTRWFNEEAAE